VCVCGGGGVGVVVVKSSPVPVVHGGQVPHSAIASNHVPFNKRVHCVLYSAELGLELRF